MNAKLTDKVSDEEIKRALFSIGPTCPDGFNASFYQQHWEIVGAAIINEVRNFLETGLFPQVWNHTNFALYQKSQTLKP